MIVIMAGLPGTGRAHWRERSRNAFQARFSIRTPIRAALFQPAHVEYSLAQDDFCQEIMLQTSAYLLAKDAELHVLLDGRTFSRRYQRERVTNSAGKGGPLGPRWNASVRKGPRSDAWRKRWRKTPPAANRTPELHRQIRRIGSRSIPETLVDTDAN